jgi:hypothetical protein
MDGRWLPLRHTGLPLPTDQAGPLKRKAQSLQSAKATNMHQASANNSITSSPVVFLFFHQNWWASFAD